MKTSKRFNICGSCLADEDLEFEEFVRTKCAEQCNKIFKTAQHH